MTDKNTQNTILPDSIQNRYRLIELIGTGGMGNVYLAEDTELYRKVAIKSIKPELLQNQEVQKRIEYECRMHAAIKSHPHIVTLFDRVVDGANILLIMEYVEGTTLAELIRMAQEKNEPLPLSMAISLLRQILSALKTIHEHGIIHRDIKPSNILVDQSMPESPQAKLMDFGIAKNAEGYEQLTQLTQIDAGGPGTPAYMAPERIDAATFGDICPATDLYSVGIIFYELLCLKPPFQGTMTEIFAGQLAREPNLNELESFPSGIQEIIQKALAKKSEQRYADAESFSRALQNFLNPVDPAVDDSVPLSSYEPRDKTMLATDITEAQEKAVQQANRQQRRFPTLAIIGTVVGITAIVTILQFMPIKFYPWAEPEKQSRQESREPSQQLKPHDIPEETTVAGKKSAPQAKLQAAAPTTQQPKEEKALPNELAVTSTKKQTQASSPLDSKEKNENLSNQKKSTAALEALEEERKKRRQRELLEQEEARKKQMAQQIASRKSLQKPPQKSPSKETKRYRSTTQQSATGYIVIPGQ